MHIEPQRRQPGKTMWMRGEEMVKRDLFLIRVTCSRRPGTTHRLRVLFSALHHYNACIAEPSTI